MSAPRDAGSFRSSDLWLTASVMAVTERMEVRVERTPGERRALFVLHGVADAERIAADFRAERLSVSATALMRAVRRCKSELYDGARTPRGGRG